MLDEGGLCCALEKPGETVEWVECIESVIPLSPVMISQDDERVCACVFFELYEI